MLRQVRVLLIAVAFIAVCAAIPAQAATYYVSPSGSDSNACSKTLPCATIAKAYGLAVGGDIVVALPGTYSGSVILSRSGVAGNKIKLQGYDVGASCPSTPIADVNSRGSRPNPSVTIGGGFTINANYVVVDCFRTNGSTGADLSRSNGQHDIDVYRLYLNGSSPYQSSLNGGQYNITYKESYGTGAMEMGFQFYDCEDNCLIQDNELERITGGTGDVDHDYARIFGNGITFRHNYFHGNLLSDCPGDCHIDCFQTWNIGNAGEKASNITIDRNYCQGAHQGIIARDTANGSSSSNFNSHFNWTVTNNVWTGLMAWGLDMEHVGNVITENNTFYNCPQTGYLYGTTAVHKNNIHSGTGFLPYSANINGSLPGTITSSGNNLLYESGRTYSGFSGDIVNQNPNFVNTGASPTPNVRTQASSTAAVDKGLNLSATVITDLDGGARPSGNAFDIGAFEFNSAVASTQPPTNVTATVR
jgi:hypothetical protein